MFMQYNKPKAQEKAADGPAAFSLLTALWTLEKNTDGEWVVTHIKEHP